MNAPAVTGRRFRVLIDAGSVAAHQHGPVVAVIELGEDTPAYDRGHIRGAVRTPPPLPTVESAT